MKIALLGYDIENAAAYRYLKDKYSGAQFTIYDQRKDPARDIPEDVEFLGDVEDFKNIEADISVRTPGIALDKIQVSGEVTTVTKLFFEACEAPIIGVTGTKGKGTTCTLIAKMLEASGKKVWLVGNIGKPSLDILSQVQKDDIVVYELSSFQLWDVEKSPQTAVVLLVEPDHLNVHSSMEDYVGAKANIAKHQKPSDNMIYHPTNPESAKIAQLSPGDKQRYCTPEGAYIEDGNIIIADQTICSVSDVGLLGEHNLENICAAVTASWHYTQDVAAIKKAITEFKGLPHHTEKVRELDGVTYYDDSFSSAPAATVAAIKSFTDPEIVIVGGAEKNADFSDLVANIKARDNIKKIILIGETAPRIADALQRVGETRFEVDNTHDFVKIVARAKELAQSGDVVLLSPGCASFDMFENFYKRGEIFQELVHKL